MDFLGSGIGKQQTTADIGYNNYNSSGVKEDIFVQKSGNEGVQQLQHIPVGKAFRGEITDILGEKVHIRLDNGQNVLARLAEDMNLNIGDKILFQVKSNGGGLIEIKPVMIALQGQEGAILRALEAAKLPINDKTVALLSGLLQEQMPIDKNSVQNLYKQVLANAGADVQTIITLNKLNIPVTKENIGQFEAYKNYEHRIAAQADRLSVQITELLQEVNKEPSASGSRFHLELLQMLTNETTVLENVLQDSDTQVQQLNGNSEGNTGNLFEIKEGSEILTEENRVFAEGQLGNVLNTEERQELFSVLRELPVSEEIKMQLLNGDGKVSELLEQLQIQLEQYPQFDSTNLLQSKSYEKLLKSQIRQQWFVKSEQLAAGERMEEFYEKLRTQTKQLETMFNALGKNDSAAAKTAHAIKDNIEFMNQINQMFTYVQIPLMMSGKTAHSDLYVFTRKKSLREQEGKVSALLHLDMEELGSLDVYVEMDGMNVNTQFKLADEGLVRLFEDNMEFLTKRITEKGYHFSSQVEISTDKVDFVEDFVKRDHGNTPMQRFAFDVRA